MAQVKVCPSCGRKNPLTATMCELCMVDISAVNPTDPDVPAPKPSDAPEPGAEPEKNPDATQVEKRKLLYFETPDGRVSFSVGNEAVLGREAEGKNCFDAYQTVSRRHARLVYSNEDDAWTIEDLGSTNGTWVNERRLEPGKTGPVKAGDTVALSRSCILKVRE
ncbi:MAG: FHA domain-containing protein [bacterium]|nr:FHA domain-containing protein [bacterium]